MISLPDTLWGCTESLDMLEYREVKSPTSSEGAVLPWGTLGRILKIRLNAWLIIGKVGCFL